MAKTMMEKKDADGNRIFTIDRTKKTGLYYIKKDSYQGKIISEVHLDGFENLPSGLWKDGKGFTKGGLRTLNSIVTIVPKPKVVLSKDRKSHINGQTVVIKHDDLKRISATVRRIDSEKAAETRDEVASFMADIFPNHFKKADVKSSYRPGQVAALLKDEKVLGLLSDSDKETLLGLFPSLVQQSDFTLRTSKQLKFITDGMDVSKSIYLSKVVSEFERKLQRNHTEHVWQTFLRDYILTILNTYAAVVEKQSVSIGGKYPDFMLVDAYGYVDIYEIKKPQTPVLQYDSGRKNYYWTAELAKAISQTEKYLDEVSKNRLQIADNIRRNGNSDVCLVRPRGFIVVGNRKDLNNQDMKDDFRILNDSLKNIDILFFDDLLDNVKALTERIQSNKD